MSTYQTSASPDFETPPSADPVHQDFHARLNEAAGQVSYRKLGGLTDTHPETVRRYMQGQAPSATFLTNMCRVLGISGEWLLTGKGPMKCAHIRSHALNQADPSELMTAVANTLTDLCDRMDRLERFMQTLETRVRGMGAPGPDQPASSDLSNQQTLSEQRDQPARIVHEQSSEIAHEGDHEQSRQSHQPASQPAYEAKAGTSSAQRIRDAIAKRPS